MNKAELSKLLDQKVQEKLQDGYSITTYAMDVASRDRVKRSLKPQSHQVEHHDDDLEWKEYLGQVEAGTYQPECIRPSGDAAPVITPDNEIGKVSSSSAGQWKARRH